jgi:hypothetical protein
MRRSEPENEAKPEKKVQSELKNQTWPLFVGGEMPNRSETERLRALKVHGSCSSLSSFRPPGHYQIHQIPPNFD